MSTLNCLQGNIFSKSYPEPLLVKGLKDMNRAISGDQVVVLLLPKDQWKRPSSRAIEEDVLNANELHEEAEEEADESQDKAKLEKTKPTCKVVGILRRNNRSYCGSIDETTIEKSPSAQGEDEGVTSVIFVPVDKRIPRIKIQTRQIESLVNMRIVVSIDSWNSGSRSPEGHYIRTIGPVGNKQAETEVILLEHDVPFQPFTEAVRACLPSPSWAVADQQIEESRVDLRHLDVCSVDPPGIYSSSFFFFFSFRTPNLHPFKH